MNKSMSVVVFAIAVLSASTALAQSSGNFDAAVSPTVCTLNSSTGTLSPLCTPTADGTECVLLDTTIKTSSGNGVTLLITPSAVTGLFTNTKLSTTVNTATADIGVKVCVQVAGGHVRPNSTPHASETRCLVYDRRFQQIRNTLFTNVAICAAGNAGTICTSDAACTGGTICGPPDLIAGTRTCTCGFDLTLSTLSAHSFNFVAQVPGDIAHHHVQAQFEHSGG